MCLTEEESSAAVARGAEKELKNHPPSESDDCLFDEAWDYWFAAEELKFADSLGPPKSEPPAGFRSGPAFVDPKLLREAHDEVRLCVPFWIL